MFIFNDRSSVICCFIFLFLIWACGEDVKEIKDNGQAESLTVLQYLGNRAGRLEAELPPIPENLEVWEKRREQVQRELTSLLGLPKREPMRAKVLSSRTEKGVVVEDVIYLWAERLYVPAIVVRPANITGRMPALVVPPGFKGSSKVLDEGYYKPFIYHMALNGYVVIFFDDPTAGQRNAPMAGFYAAAAVAGSQSMGGAGI